MKKTMRKILHLISIFVLINILSARIAFADGSYYGDGACVPVYGGGVQCPKVGEVLIDKTVQNPATGAFVDNLGPSDPKYRPLQIATFQIKIKNSGDETLEKIIVRDTIPNFLDYMSISPSNGASYDSNLRVLTFTVDNLTGGSKQIFTLKGRVVHQAVLPANKNSVCPVNIVTAEIAGQEPDRDESQFCIEKKMEVPAVPAAGPEDWILSLGGVGTAAIIGLYLRRKAIARS